MNFVVRALVGVAGVLALLVGLGFWLRPDSLAAEFGIGVQGALGYSALRADFGALFAATGILSIAAAAKNSARLLTAPLLLIGIGFCGRLVSIALSGYEASMLQPMIVEVVLITLFATGRKALAPR